MNFFSQRIALTTSIVLSIAAGSLIAQTPAAKAPAERPIEGSLTLGGKTYKLVSVAAYETKVFDDKAINVLACDKAIPMDKLKGCASERWHR